MAFIKWVGVDLDISSAGVFTAELSALFTALRHIAEVIRPPERCLILTDSLSSIKTILSSQFCWNLCQNGIEVKLMWIQSHVGRELVNERAQQAAQRFPEFGKTGADENDENGRQNETQRILVDLPILFL
jgi:ribonuclease HI